MFSVCVPGRYGSSKSLKTSSRFFSIALVVFSTGKSSPGNISLLLIVFILNSVVPRSIDFSSIFCSSFSNSFAKPCLSIAERFSFAAPDKNAIVSLFLSGTYNPIRAFSNSSGGIFSNSSSLSSSSSSFVVFVVFFSIEEEEEE